MTSPRLYMISHIVSEIVSSPLGHVPVVPLVIQTIALREAVMHGIPCLSSLMRIVLGLVGTVEPPPSGRKRLLNSVWRNTHINGIKYYIRCISVNSLNGGGVIPRIESPCFAIDCISKDRSQMVSRGVPLAGSSATSSVLVGKKHDVGSIMFN
jgi:hypothetical protein